MQQAVDVVLAPGDGGGTQPAVIGGAVAGLEAGTDVLARFDDVGRVEGEVTHRTADGTAAIQHRRRATQDLHALDDLRVDIIALGLGIRAVEEAVRHFHAVDLGQDPVAVDAADVIAVEAAALAGAADRNAGFIAHQVLDRVDVLPVQVQAVVHRHGTGYLADFLGLAGGTDRDLLQGDGRGGFALEHDIVAAEFAIAQFCPREQTIQGLPGGERTVYARRRHALSQFGRQPHLPPGHVAESVECRGKRLAGNGKAVVAHFVRSCRSGFGGQGRAAVGGRQHGNGQQGERAELQPTFTVFTRQCVNETRGHQRALPVARTL
ncbi:hypothetical protein D3C84_172570 [compost metagenome]